MKLRPGSSSGKEQVWDIITVFGGDDPVAYVTTEGGRDSKITKIEPVSDRYRLLFHAEKTAGIPFDDALLSYRPNFVARQHGGQDKGSGGQDNDSGGKDEDIRAEGEIAKIEPEEQMVFGWAYVTNKADGSVNVDKSGDFVDDVKQIEKSAYDYVLRSRNGDSMHDTHVVSTIVESMVFTPEKIEKMGLTPGTVPLGWWVGFKISDDAVWDRVKKGELRAFSIGGKGTRKKVEE